MVNAINVFLAKEYLAASHFADALEFVDFIFLVS
jgi:hypothetical protein